jgi:hypothetical protein
MPFGRSKSVHFDDGTASVKAVTHEPYIRAMYTGALFDTRTYGPYTRATKNAPVYTARIYGP